MSIETNKYLLTIIRTMFENVSTNELFEKPPKAVLPFLLILWNEILHARMLTDRASA